MSNSFDFESELKALQSGGLGTFPPNVTLIATAHAS